MNEKSPKIQLKTGDRPVKNPHFSLKNRKKCAKLVLDKQNYMIFHQKSVKIDEIFLSVTYLRGIKT